MLPTELAILYEDKYLLALNKPQGIVSENEVHLKYSLQSLALDYIRSKEKYPQKCFIGLPHRLDRPVSGVILLAKKKSVLKMLTTVFYNREIEKSYLTITKNAPTNQEGELVNWLMKDAEKRKAIIYDTEIPGSLRVILRYKFISQNEHGALLQIKLITGKYHQIRAQLSHIGCAIIGDAHYGSAETYKENSICLHARNLKLIHPITQENLNLVAQTPDDEIWNSFNATIK